MDKIKQLGQYFTPDFVADFMVSLSTKSKDSKVLEPSCGEGVFLNSLNKAGYSNYIGLEIDKTLPNISDHSIRYESFISAVFEEKFDLIIGNPPYVRWKNMSDSQKEELNSNGLWNQYFNSLSDYLYIFILKSVEILEDDGELIFITPEYWLNTMHSQNLRNYLLDNGYIKEIYHFNETPIFNKVASSIIIFKYVKSKTKKSKEVDIYKFSSKKRLSNSDLQVLKTNDLWSIFKIKQFEKNDSLILAPDEIKNELKLYEDKCHTGYEKFHNPTLTIDDDKPYVRLGDISNIANGLVSGLDKAFQIPNELELNTKESSAVLDVIKAKDLQSFIKTNVRRYIFLNEIEINEDTLKSDYPNFYNQLQPYKDDLHKRYSYNRDIKYWEWVFLRSMKLFKQNRQKIFVPCKERITNKSHLRFGLASPSEYPTQDITAIYLNDSVQESIYYILALLNSKVTYDWVKYKGLMKGGIAEFSERPLSMIPIRMINWDDNIDVSHHDKIVEATNLYMSGDASFEEIDKLVLELLS